MVRVGLTGGLATGKSYVADILERLGCYVLRADVVGHEVLLPGGEAYEDVAREFGADILDSDGRIIRKRLAAEVFGKPDRLAALNAIVHPAVFRREDEWIAHIKQSDPAAITVVEAAILIETGSYKRFQKLIVTVCTEELQIQRAMARDGCTMEEVRARLAHQMPLSEKARFADYLIDTSLGSEETERQTRIVFEALRRVAI